ncbi:MAG: VgrG-related protein [Anaerolineae bacterium]|nr:VgrG-related protein [Anaerolineae bacterium]
MPQRQKLISHIFIRVNGADLSAQLMDDLTDVTVDTNLYLPDMFVIQLHDESLESVDQGPFDLGAEVEIGIKAAEGSREDKLIVGEITALEPDFGKGTQAMLVVRGYDRSHRLHRGTHTQAFTQVTDSDLAQRIAQEVGLRTDVDATSQIYEHVLQDNQTHMAFLRARAERIGYQVYVRERTLYFKRAGSAPSGDAVQLEWGNQLKRFRPRLTLTEQVDEVVVKGWDPKNKAEITGSATRSQASPQIGESRSGGQLASDAFGEGKRVVVHQPVTSQSEADAVAQALYDEINGGFVEAEGECHGAPTLKAGCSVDLDALGLKFNGTYYVTSATHLYRADGDYRTTFTVTGRRPETLYRLLGPSDEGQPSRWGGVVTAIVTNNNDPEDQGRVKLKYPWMSDDVETGWARVGGIGAGDERGLYCLPEVNDEVLVAFEHGDANRPLVLGGLWNGVDKPTVPASEAIQNGNVHTRAFKTRSGHALTFVDDSEGKVRLETAGGHSLLLDDENRVVQIETSGGIVVKLDDGSGDVTIQCSGKLDVQAQRDIAFKAGANLNLEATGQVTIKGATIDLN